MIFFVLSLTTYRPSLSSSTKVENFQMDDAHLENGAITRSAPVASRQNSWPNPAFEAEQAD